MENVCELQLCAITLVTAVSSGFRLCDFNEKICFTVVTLALYFQVFSRYEKHRQLILEEIFNSLARLPTSKRNLRNFR